MPLTSEDKQILKDFIGKLQPGQKEEIKKALDELDRKYAA